MNWLFNNINYMVAPQTMLLGIFSAVLGYSTMSRRKRGLPPADHQGLRASMIIFIVLSSIFGGMLLAHNHYAR